MTMNLTLRNVLQKFLSSVYILAGGLKIYPPTATMALHMNKTFEKFSEVFPTVSFGYKPDLYTYRVSLGWVELLLGLSLLIGSKSCQKMSSCCLLVIMGGAVHTMISLKEYSQIVVPASFFLMLCYYISCLTDSKPKTS